MNRQAGKHPIDYEAELEDEEEEASPVSDKRLKREMRAEAIRRLEEAARTEKDFQAVVEEWNKLDRNRERRERDGMDHLLAVKIEEDFGMLFKKAVAQNRLGRVGARLIVGLPSSG